MSFQFCKIEIILGLFIRHMLLAFDKLSFSLVTKLCSKLNNYFDAAFEPCLDESVEVNSSDSPLDEKLDERYVLMHFFKKKLFF